jgi:hypothetical protein
MLLPLSSCCNNTLLLPVLSRWSRSHLYLPTDPDAECDACRCTLSRPPSAW